MIINSLKVAQVRAFDEAEFEFRPGMNLLVGINGVGKSTVLDALRILLSHVLKELSAPRSRPLNYTSDDITVGRDFLTTEISCEADGAAFSYLIHNPREDYVTDKMREGEVREQVVETPDLSKWTFAPDSALTAKKLAQQLRKTRRQPLAVFFSPHRSLTSLAAAKEKGNDIASAVAESLQPRELRLREFADWWLTREALAGELKSARPQLDALRDAVGVFLDDCRNLRAVSEPQHTLLIDKAGLTLDVRQLSDGERGMLALVLDLTRRLSQANPALDDPVRDGEAVVLIDELDLHLHPKWQRTIVRRLTETFPRCQFVATTHSPQIISEVQPDSLNMLYRDGARVHAQRATQAYGLDSNWILNHLLDVPSRPELTQEKIEGVEEEIEEGDFDAARTRLEDLRRTIHGDDGETVRLEASINTLEILADEVDTEAG